MKKLKNIEQGKALNQLRWLFKYHFEKIAYEDYSVADWDDGFENYPDKEVLVCKHCSTAFELHGFESQKDAVKHFMEDHAEKEKVYFVPNILKYT